MKNNEIEVSKDGKGFIVTVKQSRLDLLKALFTGSSTLVLDEGQSKLLSKLLYVPVKKTYKKAAKPAAEVATPSVTA
jgi:hypothetical protein